MSKVSVEKQGMERRRTERAQLVVRIDYGTIDELFSEFTRDINEGGLFIETEKLMPTDTEVTMHFNLPGSHEGIRTVGRVVHSSSGDAGSPPGLGIEFEELAPEDREKINELIRALRSGGPGAR